MFPAIHEYLQEKKCIRCGGCGLWIVRGKDNSLEIASEVKTDSGGNLISIVGSRRLVSLRDTPGSCRNRAHCALRRTVVK